MTSRTPAPATERAAPRIEVRRMDAYDRDIRDEVIGVILDGYFEDLSLFSRRRHDFVTAFRDHIRAERFYVAELEDRIVGVLACTDNTGRALVANGPSFRRGLGRVRGTIAARVLGRQFNPPLDFDDDTGYVEWVATSGHARGQGVSTALFRHLMQASAYRTLVLEVIDSNENARRLYARLGFVEYERKPARGLQKLSFTERYLMRWSSARSAGDPRSAPDPGE